MSAKGWFLGVVAGGVLFLAGMGIEKIRAGGAGRPAAAWRTKAVRDVQWRVKKKRPC